jgi:hypothetical protein
MPAILDTNLRILIPTARIRDTPLLKLIPLAPKVRSLFRPQVAPPKLIGEYPSLGCIPIANARNLDGAKRKTMLHTQRIPVMAIQ